MPSSTRMPPRTLPYRCRVRDDCREDHGRKRHVAGTSERDSRSGRAIEGRKAIFGCEKQMFGAE